MTDKEKLEKLKKLADAMYYAAQYLTTDASRLHKAMDEYHKFIIHECKEEPKDKCKGCNNVKGCITCVDGSEYAHIEECNITGITSKHATGKLKELIEIEEARKQLEYSVNNGLDLGCGVIWIDKEPVSEDNTLRKASEEYLKVLSETPYNNTPITNAQTIVRELITFLDNPSKYNHNHIEEPVSEDLREASRKYFKSLKDSCFISSDIMLAFKAGAKWQKKYLWKSADGEDLPEYEREVVVFTQDFPNDAGIMKVAIAHRPNPKGWDEKNIATGEVKHYTPKTYGKGGWNIPDVIIWLDVDLPKMEKF